MPSCPDRKLALICFSRPASNIAYRQVDRLCCIHWAMVSRRYACRERRAGFPTVSHEWLLWLAQIPTAVIAGELAFRIIDLAIWIPDAHLRIGQAARLHCRKIQHWLGILPCALMILRTFQGCREQQRGSCPFIAEELLQQVVIILLWICNGR